MLEALHMRKRPFLLVMVILPLLHCGGSSTSDVMAPPSAGAESPAFEEPKDPFLAASFVVNAPTSIGANSGVTCDGCTLTPPTGFKISECVFSVALNGSSPNATRQTLVDSNGTVSCQSVSTDSSGRNKTTSCAPSFMMVCAK